MRWCGEELNLPYTYKDMQEMLTVTNPSDTRVLYITVKNTDPNLAMKMANSYAKAAKKFIVETMDSGGTQHFLCGTGSRHGYRHQQDKLCCDRLAGGNCAGSSGDLIERAA